jgi:nitrogen regulatory protein P-II 2
MGSGLFPEDVAKRAAMERIFVLRRRGSTVRSYGVILQLRGEFMRLLKSIIRPDKVDQVKEALSALHVSGLTVTEVRGHGKQKGHTAVYRGQEYDVSLLPKMQIEVVVPDEIVDEAIKGIIRAARTGEIGDGRVFVIPVMESYRIRTGELER